MFGSLKSSLYFLVFLIALPGIIYIFFDVARDRESSVASYKKQAINTAKALADSQTNLIVETQNYLKYLSTLKDAQSPSSPECSQLLSHILKLNPSYVNVGIPRSDGELLCNAFPLKKRVNVFDRQYFQQSLTKKVFAIGAYQLDRAAKNTSVNFSYPVLDENEQVVGVAVAVVSLDWWSKQLSEFLLPNGSLALISDENLSVVANFPVDSNVHGNKVDFYNLSLKQSHEYDLYTEVVEGSDNVTRIFTHQTLYEKFDGKTVTVSIGIPIDDALNAANYQFIRDLIFFFTFLFVITFIATRRLKTQFLVPLNEITQATEQLEQGEAPSELHSKGINELDTLAKRFKYMASARLASEKEAMQRSDELDSIFNALPDLFFRLDVCGTILDYRASAPGDLYAAPTDFLGKRMQDVLPVHLGELFNQKIDHFLRTGEQLTWEYPLEIDGTEEHFEARINAIKNTHQLIIVVRNITQKKRDEDSLKQAASVFENSSECMTVTTPDGVIIDVNPAFTRVMGYAPEEVIGLKTSKMSSGKHDKAFYESLWGSLEQSGSWQGEIYNKRKSGEVFPEWLSINAIYNDRDEVVNYVALYRDISEQKKATEIIWRQAHFDSLTGLSNRITLTEHLDHEISKAKRTGSLVACLFLDLDEFKQINDSLGHDKGDLLLQKVSNRLLSCARDEDLISRQGGDEFIIIMGNLPCSNPATRLADQILQAFSKPFELEDEVVYISASIGISLYPSDASNSSDLLKAADQAMYVAKYSGKSCFQCFTQDIQDDAVRRVQLLRDLHIGLEQAQFELYLQPIVSLVSGELLKAEALIRWNHPTEGILSPDTFIPIAEETRLISELGEWVFEEGCRLVKQIQQDREVSIQVSINVSPVQFTDMTNKLSLWPKKLQQSGLEGTSIVVEITEGLLMDTGTDSLSTLLGFRDAGIQVALDDFGTGYSSLAYIRQYDIDYLKIDQQFVKNMFTSSDTYILCKSIIVMSHQLGIKVIAEGVETREQLIELQNMGCDYAQGYLFSKPVTIEEFNKLPQAFF